MATMFNTLKSNYVLQTQFSEKTWERFKATVFWKLSTESKCCFFWILCEKSQIAETPTIPIQKPWLDSFEKSGIESKWQINDL